MPAVRGVNLRSGDLNEEYGLFLLRLFGAVAPVPRTEDVGVDAFLTLLHNEGELYRAGRTCMVQLKSHSEGVSVVYFDAKTSGELNVRGETTWLKELDYPLFFGRVSRGGQLELYATQQLLEWFLDNPGQAGIGICFEEVDESPVPANGFAPVRWLGPPILTMGIEHARDAAGIRTQVDLLSEWVKLMQENLALFPLGMLRKMRWQPNTAPETVQYTQLSREPSEQEAERALRDVSLRLAALSVERLYHGEESDLEHLFGLFEMVARDFPHFTFGEEHSQFLRLNIDHLRERRLAYRLARQTQARQSNNP